MGLFKTLFGGSSSKQSSSSQSQATNESGNKAYDWIYNHFSDAGTAQQYAFGTLQGLLNQADPTAQEYFQNNWRRTPGYQFLLNEGNRMVQGSAAARGTLQSGNTLRALQDRAMGVADQTYNKYVDDMYKFGNLGIQAGGLIGQAGQYSKGQSTSNSKSTGKSSSTDGGLFNIVAALPALSDRRAKENIVKVDEFDDGLGIYEYNYIGDDRPQIGVMADEVAELRPWALGPEIDGYSTVYYGRL